MTDEVNVPESIHEDEHDSDPWGVEPSSERPVCASAGASAARPINAETLACQLAGFAHSVGSPSAEALAPEPNATVHEILWALYLAIENKDPALLKELHAPAVKYLRANPEADFSFSRVGVVSKSEFAKSLVSVVKRILARDPHRDPAPDDPDDWTPTDLDALAGVVASGARAYPQLVDLDAVTTALGREFGAGALDRRADPIDIAERALRAVGVSAKEAWNLLHAAERMRLARSRKQTGTGQEGA